MQKIQSVKIVYREQSLKRVKKKITLKRLKAQVPKREQFNRKRMEISFLRVTFTLLSKLQLFGYATKSFIWCLPLTIDWGLIFVLMMSGC